MTTNLAATDLSTRSAFASRARRRWLIAPALAVGGLLLAGRTATAHLRDDTAGPERHCGPVGRVGPDSPDGPDGPDGTAKPAEIPDPDFRRWWLREPGKIV